MAGYFEDNIIARLPLYWNADKLALLHVKTRALVGIAEPIGAYAFDDPRGAELSKRVDKERRNAIRQLDRSVPDIDTVEEGLRLIPLLPVAPITAPIAHLSINKEHAETAAMLAETPAARDDRQREKNLKAQRRDSTAISNLAKRLKGN